VVKVVGREEKKHAGGDVLARGVKGEGACGEMGLWRRCCRGLVLISRVCSLLVSDAASP
jgi:hypothetical protein